MPNAGRPAYYTISHSAWILGVESSTVARLIRVGTLRAVRRRGQLVIPSSSLARLLPASTGNDQVSGGAR